jgi:matrixin
LACLFFAVAAAEVSAEASVLVVTNRGSKSVPFAIAVEPVASSSTRQFNLAAGDVMPIAVSGPAQLFFKAAGRPKAYRVVPFGIYYFANTQAGQLDLQQIGLGPSEVKSYEALRPADKTSASDKSTPATVVIPVKILYDEDEIAAGPAWERRMRARFEQVSQVFQKHCFARFEIVAIETWESSDDNLGVPELLGEFERLVDPAPARLAIGFTGQNRAAFPHLGGTRGPLHTHLIVREWAAHNTEAERLEVLLHELGHFLGAVHSPESNSVMRPALGDHQAHAAKFRIGFDPLNTLAMCLVVGELKDRPQVRFSDMQDSTRFQLRRIYTELAHALPNDPAAPRYLLRLGREDAKPDAPPR